jgi:hypothetical protein
MPLNPWKNLLRREDSLSELSIRKGLAVREHSAESIWVNTF